MTMLNMLTEIKADLSKSMEFGDPESPLGLHSGIRIRYMVTAGGYQYRLCTLDSSGRESSGGIYEPDEESALIQAVKMEQHYLRPVLHRHHLKAPSERKLQWFITTEPVKPAIPYDSPRLLGEVIVILGGKPEGTSHV
jgi:hypothetical protein